MSKRKGFKAAVGSALNDEAAGQPSPALESWLSPTTESRVDQVPVGEISDPDWRRALDAQDPAYRALKASVRASGILQPVLLRPLPGGGYQVISGMRRVRAARDTFQDTVPATVRQLTEVEAIVGSLDALMRDPITADEREAIAQRLRDGGMPGAEAAALLGALRLGGVEAELAVVAEAPAAPVAEEAPAAAVVEEAPAAAVVEEAPAAEVVEEAPAAEVVEEAPAAEVVEEAPAASVVEEAPAAEVVEEAPATEVVEEAPAVAMAEDAPAAEVVDEASAVADEEAAEAMVAEGAPDTAEVGVAPAPAEHPAVAEVTDAIAAAFEVGLAAPAAPEAPVAPAAPAVRETESTAADIAAAFEAGPLAAAPPDAISASPAAPERPKPRTERKPAPAEKDRPPKRTSRVISIDLPGPSTSGAGAVVVAPPRSIAPALPAEPIPAARPAPPGNVAVRVVKDPRFWATVGTFIAVWATVFILVGVALGSGSARLLIIAAIIAAAGFSIAIVALAVPRRSP